MRWLVLRLQAPLVAFGDVAVDGRGATRDHPTLSAITGLVGNALGLDRCQSDELQALQDDLVIGSCFKAARGDRITDFQTAKLAKNDTGWTHAGKEGRGGGADSYDSPVLLHRDYFADRDIWMVLGLANGDEAKLDRIASALDRPERPLFIGRKSCLPADRLLQGFVEADDARSALLALPAAAGSHDASWPLGQGAGEAGREMTVSDRRNWRSDLHGGSRRVLQGRLEIGASA